MIDNKSHVEGLYESSKLTLEAIDLVRNKLPFSIYPRQTIDQYPRIIDMTALLWNEPDGFRKYFDELLNDDRGDRQGFPFEVLMEIGNIREEHERQHPDRKAVLDLRLDQLGRRL
ncbi:MAG: hypothetical protein HGA75_14045 [Thiobacillus sp.]|nr:hypothetical protein [Thiobacillus sp.]